jgi:hypothetical protein
MLDREINDRPRVLRVELRHQFGLTLPLAAIEDKPSRFILAEVAHISGHNAPERGSVHSKLTGLSRIHGLINANRLTRGRFKRKSAGLVDKQPPDNCARDTQQRYPANYV